MSQTQTTKPPFHMILLLILAGESIFLLPFVLARIFRPTFLDVFHLNNFELGTCFSIYGIVAFISYAWGGTLAARAVPIIIGIFSVLVTNKQKSLFRDKAWFFTGPIFALYV